MLPTSSSQMITFTFEDGSVATLRTSGTEPKIKYYVEVKLPPGGYVIWFLIFPVVIAELCKEWHVD